MELLKRIDRALESSGKTRADLARELGISTQAITSLGRRPNARMKHENLVRAAEAMQCDVDWLATGRGGYRAAGGAARAPAAPKLAYSGTPKYDRDAEDREMRASMVAWMFNDLTTDADRDAVVAFLADLLAKARKARA